MKGEEKERYTDKETYEYWRMQKRGKETTTQNVSKRRKLKYKRKKGREKQNDRETESGSESEF